MSIVVSHKICRGCKIDLGIDRFTKDNSAKSKVNSTCRQCRKEYVHRPDVMKRIRAREEMPGVRAKRRASQFKGRINNPIRSRARSVPNSMMHRSRRQGTEFDGDYFTFERVMDMMNSQDRCLACNVLFDHRFGNGSDREQHVSFDRVSPKKGYVKGNVQMICYRCNRMKNDATIQDLENLLAYSKKYGGK